MRHRAHQTRACALRRKAISRGIGIVCNSINNVLNMVKQLAYKHRMWRAALRAAGAPLARIGALLWRARCAHSAAPPRNQRQL